MGSIFKCGADVRGENVLKQTCLEVNGHHDVEKVARGHQEYVDSCRAKMETSLKKTSTLQNMCDLLLLFGRQRGRKPEKQILSILQNKNFSFALFKAIGEKLRDCEFVLKGAEKFLEEMGFESIVIDREEKCDDLEVNMYQRKYSDVLKRKLWFATKEYCMFFRLCCSERNVKNRIIR